MTYADNTPENTAEATALVIVGHADDPAGESLCLETLSAPGYQDRNSNGATRQNERRNISNMKPTVDGRAVVAAGKGTIWCNLNEEMAILDIETGTYFLLNTVAARTWELIEEPRSVTEICKVLLEEYEVELEQCERELLTLLNNMADKGLIEVKNGNAP